MIMKILTGIIWLAISCRIVIESAYENGDALRHFQTIT